MKCLLCRITNQYTELQKHPNNTNFTTIEILVNKFLKLCTSKELDQQSGKEMKSIRECPTHTKEKERDSWMETTFVKLQNLSTKGMLIKQPRS